MDREHNFECDGCDNEFTIIVKGSDYPEMCPFCGSDLDNSSEDEEIEDEEDFD